jgi:hypothetical protein
MMQYGGIKMKTAFLAVTVGAIFFGAAATADGVDGA